MLVLGLAVAISDAGTATAVSSPTAKVAPRQLPSEYDSYELRRRRAGDSIRWCSSCGVFTTVESGKPRDTWRRTSSGPAIGPMQFLPDTWAAYGVDADHDGAADPLDLSGRAHRSDQLALSKQSSVSGRHARNRDLELQPLVDYVRAVLARAAELHRSLGV